MKKLGLLALLAAITTGELHAQVDTTLVEDGERIYVMPSIRVVATQLRWGEHESLVGLEMLHHVLKDGGASLIRRGVMVASDVYLDGFKRGDVEVVIDGERYPSSCPNRMDPPLVRVNPLEMAVVRIDRTSGSLQSGLGGRISYERSEPSAAWLLRGGMTRMGGGAPGTDVAAAVESHRHRITGRFVEGAPYRDGAGRTFRDLYGYASNDFQYRLGEVSAQGAQGSWEFGAGVSMTSDVPFPYLHMDERENDLWNAFAAYRGNKLYLNRTRHVMDNGLRASGAGMPMETRTTNFTAGLSGERYEVYFRRWDGWNTSPPPMDASIAAPVDQHMIPDVRVLASSVFHEMLRGGLALTGRAGASRVWIADDDRLPFFQSVNPDARADRIFIPFSVTAGYTFRIGAAWTGGLVAEAASDAPATEYLYVALRRPMGRPAWIGNPELPPPLKVGLRAVTVADRIRTEVFAHHVWDFPALQDLSFNGMKAVTYSPVDAVLVGANLTGNWPLADVRATYTLGQDLTNRVPLAEILPLSGMGMLRWPVTSRLNVFVRAEAAAAQKRVDVRLNEAKTPAWMRIDAGGSVEVSAVRLTIEIVNALDEEYAQHLSYLRDPFAAGVRIFEPGRTVRGSLQFNL